jgi:hypothetical protein
MMSRDRIKERCRVPTRELLGLVAGTWLAAFLFPPYLGGDDGSAGGPRAGEIRESVSGLCLDGDLGAAAQPGRGPPPKPFAACETGNVCLARGTWNAECIDELCLCPRGTYVDQVDASSGAYNRLAKGPVPGRGAVAWARSWSVSTTTTRRRRQCCPTYKRLLILSRPPVRLGSLTVPQHRKRRRASG